MDKMQEIDHSIEELKKFQSEMISAIEDLNSEKQSVKDSMFGLSTRIRSLITKLLLFSSSETGHILHEVAKHGLEKNFESKQEYIDYLSDTINKVRDCVNKCDQITANLQKNKQDLHYVHQSADDWLRQAKELVSK